MNIAVFCGSRNGNNESYKQLASDLGFQIAKRGHSLIYGAGRFGLMNIVAQSALDAHGCVVGISCPSVQRYERQDIHPYRMNNLQDRKAKFIEISDCFIAIPGGTGTLDEILDVLASQALGETLGRMVLLDPDEFYEPLTTLLFKMQVAKFNPSFDLSCFDNVIDCLDSLESHSECIYKS